MKVTQVKIGNVTVGIVGLFEAFEEVKALGIAAPEDLKREIFDRVRAKNYVSDKMADLYREDLYEEYRLYAGEIKERKRKAGALEVRVYGAGCPRCEELDMNAMAALSEKGMDADYLYVKDEDEIKRAGVMATPALVINGKLAAVGTVPDKNQIKKIIDAAVKEGG